MTIEVYCGDCRTVLSTLAAKSVKAGVTSPMYNLGKSYGPGSPDDDRPLAEYLREQGEIAAAIARVLTADGHFFFNVGANSKHPWRSVQVAMEYGKHLTLQQPPFTWVKSIAANGNTLPKHLRDEMHERQVGHFQSINSNYYVNPTTELVWHFSPNGRSQIDRLAEGVGVPYVWADQPARFGHYRELHCRGSAIHIPYKTTQSRADRDYHPAPLPRGAGTLLPPACRLSPGRPGAGSVLRDRRDAPRRSAARA